MSTASPAPQGIRPEEVRLLIEELAPVLGEARVDKVFDLPNEAFLFRFRLSEAGARAAHAGHRAEAEAAEVAGAPTFAAGVDAEAATEGADESEAGSTVSRRLQILFSVRRGFSRFHVTPDPSSPRDRHPTPPAMELREVLNGAKVTRIDQPGNDRLVRITFTLHRGGRLVTRELVLEMFGARGRLLVCQGPQREVLFAFGRGGLSPGAKYRFPEPPARSESVLLPFDPRQHIPDEFRDEVLAFHSTLARNMSEAEARADFETRRDEAARRLRQERKRRLRLAQTLRKDRDGAARWEEWQRWGELLKAELGRLQRGMAEIEVVDYYDPELPRVRLELDPKVPPADNVERMFRRARKGKRGLAQIEARLEACEDELARIEIALESFERAQEPAEVQIALDSVDDVLRSKKRRRRQKGPSEVAPKTYRSREGLEILSGRSARENERLSLTVARGNDLFFHIARRPGPHVILRVPKGKNAAPESIEDASFLAAYLAGWRGPGSIDVHWTEAKWVRKPKGAPPGKVEIAREREYRVRYQPELLAKLVVESEAGGRDS